MQDLVVVQDRPLSAELQSLLNKQEIAATNLPNVAFQLPVGRAVEHEGSGQRFWLCIS